MPLIEDESTVELGASGDASAVGQTYAPGDLVAGRFRVERLLGRGGMGEVYAAHDRELGVTVAVKAVRGEIAADPAARERFRREVQLARAVTHPNVCRLFDLAIDERGGRDTLVLTMELVTGTSLADRLRADGPLTTAAATPLLAQIAAGLAAAHAAGVIHRDLKTANVLLAAGRPARAVVTDFGLALPGGAPGELAVGSGPASTIAGTPPYMAPEAAAGAPPTAAVDVYAFGCVAFEVLTGAPPFAWASIEAAREGGPAPRLRARRPDGDPGWEALIARCLDPDPARRPRDGAALVAAIAALARPAPGRRRRWVVGGGVVAVAAVMAAAIATRGGAAAPDDRPGQPGADRAWRAAQAALIGLDAATARDRLDEVIAAAPRFAPAHAAQAAAALTLGDLDAAVIAADRAAELAPAGRRRWVLLAEARRADAREHWAGAARAYEALRGLFPDDVEAQLDLARTYTAAGELDRADAAVVALRALAPDDARVELAAASVAAERGDLPAELAAAERAVALATAAAAPVATAFAEVIVAEVLAQRGELDRADATLARAVPALEAARQCARLARAHRDRGEVAWRRGQLDRASAATTRALEVAAACRDRRGQVAAQAALGLVAGARGDHATAVAQLTGALDGYRALHDDAQVAWALQALGNAAFAVGDVAAARDRWNQALALARRLGARDRVGELLNNLGAAALGQADLAAARLALAEAGGTFAAIGDRSSQATVLMGEGQLALAADNLGEAEERVRRAADERDAIGEPVAAAASWARLAEIALEGGALDRAVAALAECDRRLVGATPPPDVVAQVGLARLDLALARGDRATAAAARATLADDGDREVAIELALRDAELARRAGDLARARTAAAAAAAAARAAGAIEAALRARLALARATPAGRAAALKAIADEAAARGLHRVARHARGPA